MDVQAYDIHVISTMSTSFTNTKQSGRTILSLSLHRLYGPWRTLASRIDLQASLSLPIFLQPLTSIFFRSFSSHLTTSFLAFRHFSTLGILKHLHAFSSDILSTCPNHLSFPFLIYETIFASLYKFINSFDWCGS